MLHEASVSPTVKFTDELVIGGGNPTPIPSRYVVGLIFAVIVARVNQYGYLPPDYTIKLNGKEANMNDFWGKKDKLMKWHVESAAALDSG